MTLGYTIAAIAVLLAILYWVAHTIWVLVAPVQADAADHAFRTRFRRPLAWLHHHLLLGLLLVAVAAIAVPPAAYNLGWNAGTRFTAAYYAHRYAHPGENLTRYRRRLAATAAPLPSNLRAVYSVDLTAYWGGGDQQSTGECASWSAAKGYTLAYRLTHPAHTGFRASPQWLYDWYSDRYSGGQDAGSDQATDLQAIGDVGAVRYRLYPSGVPVTYPFPTATGAPALYADAARHRSAVTVRTLYAGDPSSGVYDEIKAALATGQVAMLAIEVPHSFDAVNETGGVITWHAGEASRGGHAVNGIQVSDIKTFSDGSTGGVKLDNQWHAWGDHNTAWASRKWINHHTFGVTIISGGVAAAKG